MSQEEQAGERILAALMLAVAIGLTLWMAIGVFAAWWAGRLG